MGPTEPCLCTHCGLSWAKQAHTHETSTHSETVCAFSYTLLLYAPAKAEMPPLRTGTGGRRVSISAYQYVGKPANDRLPVATSSSNWDRPMTLSPSGQQGGGRLLSRAKTISVSLVPEGEVTVRIIAPKLHREVEVSMPIAFGSLNIPLDQLNRKVCSLFGWKACTIEVDDSSHLISSNHDMQMAWSSYQVSESSRKRDALETVLESIRCALYSEDMELQYQACHGLWELACEEANHKYMTYTTLEGLIDVLRSPELRLKSLGAAIIWILAENKTTAIRLPVADCVPHLLSALFAQYQHMPDEKTPELAAAKCEQAAIEAGNVMFQERIVSGRLDAASVATDEPEYMNAARAVAATGYPLVDLRVWHAGALVACLSQDAAKNAFLRSGVVLRLLPMLEASQDESPPPLKAACATLLSKFVTMAPRVSKTLLVGGSGSLVRLAGGFSGANLGTRQQGANLLKFCFARVNLSPTRAAENSLLKSLPRLVGELRASVRPLMTTIRAYLSEGTGQADADQAIVLVKSIMGAIWGITSALHGANRVLPASPEIMMTLRKLMELAPEHGQVENERLRRLSRRDGRSMRTFVLGILASLGFQCHAPPSDESESRRLEEQAAYDEACSQLGSLKEDEVDEDSRGSISAASVIQAQMRGIAGRREAAHKEHQMSHKEHQMWMRRKSSMAGRRISGTDMQAIEAEVVYGPIQGRRLQALRAFSLELLALLERTLVEDQPATRVTECYAAALCSLSSVAEVALLNANAVHRLLRVCDNMRALCESDSLEGYAQRVHEFVTAILRRILSHRHSAFRANGPYRHNASTFLHAQTLRMLIGQMPLSLAGGINGAVILWLQACSDNSEAIGLLGGTEALCTQLTSAVFEHRLQGVYATLATWTACALWRLSFAATNAKIILAQGTKAILHCLSLKKHKDLNTAALGCINVVLTKQSGLAAEMKQLGAKEALHDLARNPWFRVQERLTATRTLNDVDGKNGANEEANSVDAAAGDSPNSEDSEHSDDHGAEGEEEEGRVPINRASAEDATKSDEYDEPLDNLMVSLLGDNSSALRAVGCRGIARAAQRGYAACVALTKLDAPRQVVAVLKQASQPVLSAEHARSMLIMDGEGGEQSVSTSPEITPDRRRVTLAISEEEEASVSVPEPREHELLHDALNAALNLSGAKVAQVSIARNGLWALVELWYASQTFHWTGELCSIGEMAGETLSNLASNAGNRTMMYRAELKLKTAAWSGGALLSTPSAVGTDSDAPRSPDAMALRGNGAAADLPSSPEKTLDEKPLADDEEIGSDLAQEGGQGTEPAAACEEKEQRGRPMNAKQRYLDWLDDLEAKEAAEKEAARMPEPDDMDDDGDEPHNVLLARAAFALMDINEDNELSRLEMVRAFRLDERVRELLLPLLPMPSVSRNSITGVDLQEQIDAFEALFKIMDADGSDGISRHEFETFFKLMDIKKKAKRKSSAARAARRRLAETPQHWNADRGGAKGGSTTPVRSLSMRGGSPRWPSSKAGGIRPVTPSNSSAPRLDSLMRKNYFDTWRKPIVDQMPRAPSGLLQPNLSQGAKESFASMGSPEMRKSTTDALSSTITSLVSSPSLRKGMRNTSSMPELTGKRVGRALTKVHGGDTELLSEAPSRLARDRSDAGSMRVPVKDQWHPKVSDIQITSPPGRASFKGVKLQPFEKAYLKANASEQLLYKVSLPPDEEHTSKFAFLGPVTKEKAAGKTGKLVSWVGVPGSRVGDSVAPSFSLTNGRILRLFHESHKRNDRVPFPEPTEEVPDHINLLGISSLPAHPPPVVMGERDVPNMPVGEALHLPLPLKSMLDQTLPAPSYGQLITEPFTVNVSKYIEEQDDGVKPKHSEAESPLVLDRSIFADRKKVSDGHSFFQTVQITERAFNVDWSRCNTPRFRMLIAKEDDGGLETVDIEINEIRDVLCEHRHVIYAMYTYYCACGNQHDGYAMGYRAYFEFLRDVKFIDESNPFLNVRSLESLFRAADTEDRGRNAEERDLNRTNIDDALMRFEWLQTLVRLSIAKYVRDKTAEHHTSDVSDAVSLLFENDILPQLKPEIKRDPNVFRRKRLYTKAVNALLTKHAPELKTIFEYYSSVEGGDMQLSLKPTGPMMSVAEFECFLEDCDLLLTDAQKKVGLSPLQARLCMAWSQSFVSDELKRRQQLTEATFVDFLEALGRMCCFITMPTPELLAMYDAKSAKDFYEHVEAGDHDGSVLTKSFGGTLGSWQEQEMSDEPLAVELGMLIELILDRLDESGDGKVDERDLAARRRKSHEVQKQALLAHGATYTRSGDMAHVRSRSPSPPRK